LPLETQLWQAMANDGITPPESFIIDGRLQRFGHKDAGWYRAYNDSFPLAIYGDWRLGIQGKVIFDTGREYSHLERFQIDRRMREMAEDAQATRSAQAEYSAGVAERTWEAGTPASADHPYLKRKQVQPHGTRIASDGRLMVPMYRDGELVSLQYINANADKRYQSGASTKGAWHMLGEPGNQLFIAEGFATAATIYEETGIATAVAFSAGNIPAAAEALRNAHPTAQITIVADLDESGIGKNYAEQASAKYGCRVIVSPVSSDVNDYRMQGGDVRGMLMAEDSNRFLQAIIRPEDLHSKFLETLNHSWVIKDIIPESSGLTMMYGAPGTFKSFLAIDMALCMANGIDWHGRRTKQRNVLYIAAEGQMGVLKRFEAWRIHHNIDLVKGISILPIAAKLDNHIDRIDIANAIRESKPRPQFVVIDTLARSMEGDENFKVDMAAVIATVDMIRFEFGIQTMFIHHSGKDEARGSRGSNSLPGATDTQFLIKKGNDDLTAILTCERQKDDAKNPPIGFAMKSIDLGVKNIDGDDLNSLVPVFSSDVMPGNVKKDIGKAHMSKLERAWFASGAEDVDGRPYITRTALATWLTKNDGQSEANTKQILKPSAKGKMINVLISEGYIEIFEDGFLVVNDIEASAMMISRVPKGTKRY
jgi:putative DNA primase/helicase